LGALARRERTRISANLIVPRTRVDAEVSNARFRALRVLKRFWWEGDFATGIKSEAKFFALAFLNRDGVSAYRWIGFGRSLGVFG